MMNRITAFPYPMQANKLPHLSKLHTKRPNRRTFAHWQDENDARQKPPHAAVHTDWAMGPQETKTDPGHEPHKVVRPRSVCVGLEQATDPIVT